jgi:2-polyprenyl-3-methyl-5-hydroxy-6-metoxy-1,4-benzoquinol methylase
MKSFEKKVAECYSTWGTTYYDEYYGQAAPYPPVHTDLLLKLITDAKIKTLLDAGCGPASFLRDAISLGIELFGFDLTPEMVEEAKRIFTQSQLSSDRIWSGSILNQNSFNCPKEFGIQNYDGIVCGGVLPHIPEEEDLNVAKHIFNSLNPGGLCAVEARNQLFSLFTLNRYTYEFIINNLINIDKLRSQPNIDLPTIEKMLEAFKSNFRMDLPPQRKGKQDEPGYDEVLSRTHNPFELKAIFDSVGFVNSEILFYHFHALPPMFQNLMPEVFLEKSLEMEKNPRDWRGNFMASAFYVVARKPI